MSNADLIVLLYEQDKENVLLKKKLDGEIKG